MRESWTDERLDDFRAETARRLDTLDRRLDKGFDRVDARFERMEAKFEKKFDRIDERFERIEMRFDSLHRMMLQFGAGALVTFAVGFASLIATQL